MKKIVLLLLILKFSATTMFAQQGKDGTPSITTTTIVNIYTPLTASVSAGATSITVASIAGFSAGDLIYIIQMQGAQVKANIYQFGNPNNALPNDTSFGKITAYNGAGNNEFAEVNSVSGNTITLDCALKNSFIITGNTQIIRVPRYTSLSLTGAGQITCPTWNGSTGGVAVIEVQGNTTIGGTAVDVSGKGFRGGSVLNASGSSATNTGYTFGSSTSNNGAHKGESIAGDTNVYKQVNYVAFYSNSPLAICKGNVANGGGGGDANNCGGGGGSNGGIISSWNGMGNADNSTANNISAWSQESTTPVNGSFRPTTSSGGGRGGYAFSGNNADPTTAGNGPNNNGVWAGDSRHNDGGWGGIPLDYSTGKLFLGGGAGAGDSNDKNGTSGGNGGGIFYLLSYGTVSGAGQILANGATALNTNLNTAVGQVGDDGAGGGGGGGTVIINSTGNISLTNTLAISAQGGGGGNYQFHGITTSQNFGPGGGGGGGYVSTTNAVGGTNVNGGANGIVVNGGGNNTKISTKFPPNGATAGGAGTSTISTTPPLYLTATNYTVCTSSAVSLSVTTNGTLPSGLSVMWYTVATGGTSVFSGNPYAITAPSTVGTYTYYAGTCPGTYRIPVILTVNSSTAPTLSISATSTTVCTGTPVVLTVSGATSYTWDANAGNATTNTVTVSPTSNTIYSVTGVTTGACAGTATASININITSPPTITVTPSSYTLCSGATATLTANSSTTSYTWSSNAGNATTNTVAVSPAVGSTTYTVTGGSGSCTSTQIVTINVTATPTLVVSPTNTYICNGTSATFTANGATTYSWSTSASTNTVAVSPTSNTTYTVTGFNGACSDTKTVLVKVDSGITKADSSLTSASCGQANGDYVLNTITGGILPYQINFNGTGFTAISAFSYSVNNIAGGVYPIILKDSLGCTYTTSVTIGNTSGITKVDSTVLNANCVPVNSGTISINSITGGTSPYQININGGTFNPIVTFPYSFDNLTAGIYTVSVKDGTNCPHTSFITVGSNSGISSASVTPIADTCNRHIGEINITQVTGGVPTYSFALNNGSYQTANTFTALAATTAAPDTIKIQDANGCVYTATVSITNTGVATTPTVTPVGTTTVCQGNSVTLTSSTATSYSWNTGATTQTITVSAGNTTYSVATISPNGCSANSDTVRVTVKPNPTTPVVNDTTISECQNQIQQIHFNHSSGTLIIHSSTGQLQALPFTPTTSGTYSAYDSLSGCVSAIKNISVTINSSPTTAPNVTTPVQYCIGSTASVLSATATAGATLFWQDSTHTALSTPPNPTPTTNNLGTTHYYVYQSIGSCPSPTASIQVVVVANPNPDFSSNPATDISVGQSIVFTPVQTTTVNVYAWDFEDPTNPTTATSTQGIPSYIYNTAGTYCPKLIVTNTLTGCTESRTICLDVLANISMVIPNVFSPNGDNINDVFSVKASGFTTFNCDIFDRWGLKLYSFSNTGGYWDGGKSVDGTYFYVIQSTDIKGEDHKYNGFIQLIK